MEVTTVSPSAISPTEGDDLCEIDVTNVAIHSVTLLIGLCGLAGNGAVLWLLSMNLITPLIFLLTVPDFLFLLFTVPSTLVFLLEDVSCSVIMPLMYVSFLFQLSVVSYYWGLFWVTYPSIGTAMTFLCLLCCRCHLNKHLLVWMAQSFAFFVVIVFPVMTYQCVSQEQGYCRAAVISIFSVILFVFVVSVVISRTIHLTEAKWGSQQQQPKRFDFVIILTVLFTLPLGLCNFLQQFDYVVISSQVVFLLPCINSSIKSFIYILVGSSWRPCSVGRCWRHCTVGSLRESLRRVFEDPEENTPSTNDAAMDTVI